MIREDFNCWETLMGPMGSIKRALNENFRGHEAGLYLLPIASAPVCPT